jgi:hypothetical protein
LELLADFGCASWRPVSPLAGEVVDVAPGYVRCEAAAAAGEFLVGAGASTQSSWRAWGRADLVEELAGVEAADDLDEAVLGGCGEASPRLEQHV